MEKYSSFAGKSMPMGEKIPNFSMIGVYDKQPAGIKFVKIHTKHLEGKFSVILFMDNKASDLEIKEWQAFSSSFDEFNEMNVKLIGVCTDSHIAVRAFMQDHHLQGIKFPIISDLEGELSRSFGVLKIHKDKTGAAQFDAARAVVILNDRSEMVYLQLKNEKVASDPRDIISFLRNAKAAKASTNNMESKTEEEDNISLKSNKIMLRYSEVSPLLRGFHHSRIENTRMHCPESLSQEWKKQLKACLNQLY